MAENFERCYKAARTHFSNSKLLTLPQLKLISESINLRDKKSVIDLAFRNRMLNLLSVNNMEHVKPLLKMSVAAALADICSAGTPFALFADLFNTKPLSVAEENFGFMEHTITALKDVSLFGSGRNILLRMCNDLLRRLSKSQNTVFCGRVQLFLTRLFPLDEKSGLNLMSNFNVDREIMLDNVLEDKQLITISDDDLTEYGLTNMKPTKLNTKLYERFWSLQEFLNCPLQCYTSSNWPKFVDCVDCVVDTFSYLRSPDSFDCDIHWNNSDTKFAMYLTSEKLLDLQLMDINFRMYILTQILIILQYLRTPVKFKTVTQKFDESQINWVLSKQESVFKLIQDQLENTGDQSSSFSSFSAFLNHILERESHWNRWKNQGCPSFIKIPEKSSLTPRKRRVNPLFDREGNKIFRFGNRALDKLWSMSPDNFEACRDKRKLFRPSLFEYFRETLLELDPQEKVEEEYKSMNKEEWIWRSLRLLSRRCSYFYTNWSPPGRQIKDYLTIILSEKLYPEEDKKNTSGEVNSQSTVTKRDLSQDARSLESDHVPPLKQASNKHSFSHHFKSIGSKSPPAFRASRSPLDSIESPLRFGLNSSPNIINGPMETCSAEPHLSDTDGEAEDLEEDEEDVEEPEAMDIAN